MSKKENYSKLKEYALIVVGTFIYALGIHWFLTPNEIAPGGMTGVSVVINSLTKLPVGSIYFVLNIPIIILGYLKLGKSFIFKTLLSVVLTTVFLDFVLVNFPVYTGEKVLASLYGGVLMGAGLGLNFSNGGSTGGTDVINRVIQKYLPHINIGTIVFVSDVIIIMAAVVVFKNLDTALYAIIAMFSASTLLDNIIYGLDKAKLLIIISDESEQICDKITTEHDRSCTILKSLGGYTKEEKNTILCAVRPNEYYKVKKSVYAIDPKAFMIITDSKEVIGEGFKIE